MKKNTTEVNYTQADPAGTEQEDIRKSGWNWHKVSECREELFGLAILSVMVFHFTTSRNYRPADPRVVTFANYYFNLVGSIGVEMFLFLSGMGLCFSMHRNHNPFSFYRKRILRILPPYLFSAGFYWILYDLVLKMKPLGAFWEDFSTLSFWQRGDNTFWFIPFILISYLIYPILYLLFHEKCKIRVVFLILIEAALMALIHYTRINMPELLTRVGVALERSLVFILGAYFGEAIYRSRKFSIGDYLFVLSGIVLRVLMGLSSAKLVPISNKAMNYGVHRCITGVAMVVVATAFFSIFKPRNLIRRFFAWFGGYSMEIYLTHIAFRNLAKAVGVNIFAPVNYCVCMLVAIVISVLLKKWNQYMLS